MQTMPEVTNTEEFLKFIDNLKCVHPGCGRPAEKFEVKFTATVAEVHNSWCMKHEQPAQPGMCKYIIPPRRPTKGDMG